MLNHSKRIRFGAFVLLFMVAVGAVWAITLGNKPMVFFTTPADGATFAAPATIVLDARATASDDGVTITHLDFINGSTILASVAPDGTDEYKYTWNNVAAGTYTLSAKAYDSKGAAKLVSKTITVAAANQSPTVSLTAPTNGASYPAPATINLAATASDPDGAVSKVEFYNGAQLLATDTSSPYTYAWTGVAAGTYQLTAKAYDNAQASTTSTAIAVTVTSQGGGSGSGNVPDQAVVSLASELPAHDPTVGRLDGSAGTSGGAATYTIPIDVPPGRRGMQPQISLDYSSRAGNGIAGMGWSLSGWSSLHRCPATVEQDGRVGAVALTNADKLCLDGQRLVSTSGTYGQANATYDTELESFVRVTQLGGDLQSADTYFKVETKSGDILYYGNNSTTANSARVVPGGATTPLSWMLVRREDRAGNFMHYTYFGLGNGEVLLININYTGYGSTDGDRSVDFNYEPRPIAVGSDDRSSSYLAGGLTQQTQRLKRITTYVGTEKVRDYTLDFGAGVSAATGRSLLQSVQVCAYAGAASSCRPPTTFAWQAGPPTYKLHSEQTLSQFGNPPTYDPRQGNVSYLSVNPLGDLNGDGTQELFWSGPSKTSIGQIDRYLLSLNGDHQLTAAMPLSSNSYLDSPGVDFDMDGRADLTSIDSNGHLIVQFWHGPANASDFAHAFTDSWDTGIVSDGSEDGRIQDMNGDGRADIVTQVVDVPFTYGSPANSCYAHVVVYGNVAPSTPGAPSTFPQIASVCVGQDYTHSLYAEGIQKVADFNGDGLPDILLQNRYETGGVKLTRILFGTRNTGGGYSLTSKDFSSLFPSGDAETGDEKQLSLFSMWADLNGDGLEDWIYARPESGTGKWTVRLNNGKGLGNRILLPNSNGLEKCQNVSYTQCNTAWVPWRAGLIRTADTDADGRAEILYPKQFAARICRFHAPEPYPACNADSPGMPPCSEPYYYCPEDPSTGQLSFASAIIGTGGTGVRDGNVVDRNGDGRIDAYDGDLQSTFPQYGAGKGSTDRSTYTMSALRLVETSPGVYELRDSPTSVLSKGRDTDMYGDGLGDLMLSVACNADNTARDCGVPIADGTTFVNFPESVSPTSLPDGVPLMSNDLLIDENQGASASRNPNGITPQTPDLMSMVTDGLGNQTVWTYYPLSSSAGRTAGQTPLYSVPSDPAQRYVDDRHIYFTSSMNVVSDMATSDGIGGYHAVRYGYSEAMYNEQGRGFQGFRTITEEDETAGLRTTTVFNQKFPLASQVQEVFVNALARNGTDAPIKHELYTWRCNRADRNDVTACTPPNGNAAIKFPFLDKKETWTYDATVAAQPTGTPQPIGYSQDINADRTNCTGSGTLATASGFDAYGNLTKHTVLSSDIGTGSGGFRSFVALQCQNTRSSYTANTSTWWLDRLDSATTTSAITYDTTNHSLPNGTPNPAQTATVDYTWNADRTLASQIVQGGVVNQQKVTTYTYPSSNNYGLPSAVAVAASGDANGTRSSSIAYSVDGYFPSITTNALGQQTQVTTSPRDGQLTLAIDANGLRTLMTYDVFGQLVRTQYHGTSDSVQAAPDKLFARSWCSGACLPGPQALFKTTEVQDGTPTRIIAYDQLGRTLLSAQWAWDNTLPIVLTEYNTRGQVSRQSNPYDYAPQHLFWTTFDYDLLGRVTRKIVPKGSDDGRGDLKTTYAYSGGQTAIQVCGTADVGTGNCLNMTRTTDSMGKYMETVDAQGGLTRYWTDPTGNTLALEDANSSVTTAHYNAIGQRSSVSDPNQGTWNFAYDALGEVLSQTDARGVVTTSSYDKLGRPLARNATVDVTGDNVADTVADSWTYDPFDGVGKPATSQRLVNGAVERKQVYTYDGLARPIETDTTQQIATGQTKSYTQTVAYDGYYGRPKSTGYPNGEAVATYYSKYGIPLRNFDPVSGQVYRELTAVDLAGNPTTIKFGDGLISQSRSYRIPTGEITRIESDHSGSALRQLDYQYDIYGNLSRQTLNAGQTVEDYAYDTLQRMTQATRSGAVNASISYAYDAVGNFTSKSDFSTTAPNAYSYTGGSCGGGANAVKSVAVATGGTRTYCYDADGNLTSDSAGLAVKYDHDNLAYQTTRGAATIYLAYGPDNQRTRQWGSDGLKVYVDGYEDWIGTGSSKVYIGSDVLITRAGSTRTVDYMLTDRLGSVDAIADSSGNLVETRGNDAFGKPRSGIWADLSPARLQSIAITTKGFTEHEQLNAVELIHMNGRVYDYQLGKFLSVDPFIQFPLNSQSLNPYSYVLNNPLSGTDPTGYMSESICDIGVSGTRAGCESVQIAHSAESTSGPLHQPESVCPVCSLETDNGKQAQGTKSPKNILDCSDGGGDCVPHETQAEHDAWAAIDGKGDGAIIDETADLEETRLIALEQARAHVQLALQTGHALDNVAMEGAKNAPYLVAMPDIGVAEKLGAFGRAIGRFFGLGDKVALDATDEAATATIRGATSAEDAGREIGILHNAAKGKGNFGLGSGTRAEADKLGRAWVGDDYEVASDGKTLISKDRLRQYRPPNYKPKLDKIQANFEQRFPDQKSTGWQSNGHLDITD